jgi:hypothetical protein
MELSNIISNIIKQEVKSGYAFAEVTAFTSTAPKTCSIKLSGSTRVISGIRYLNNYTPSVADIVLVLILDKDLIVIDTLEP